MARLEIVTPHGTWRQAPVDPLRPVKSAAAALRNRWKMDGDYIAGGPAITIAGTNRYNGQPVDAQGSSFDLWVLVQEWKAAFPDLPKRVPRSVDRRQNHNPTAPVSDHAKGKASDQYPWSRERMWAFVDWLDARMNAAPVVVTFEGRKTQAGVDYWVFDGWVRYAGSPRRRLKPTSNQHRDHAHITVGLVDRRKQASDPTPPAKPPTQREPRRTLRYRGRWLPRMTGDDVRLVQEVVGTKVVDGIFGPVTRRHVMAWQRANGLHVDGVVGPRTWAAIDEAVEP